MNRNAGRTATVVAVMALMFGLIQAGGCSTVIKESVGAFRGAKGLARPVEPVTPAGQSPALAGYTGFRVGRLSDPYNQLPAGFPVHLERAFSELLGKSDLPTAQPGKTLEIRGEVIYFELNDTVGLALGEVEEVIVRAEMIDVGSGKVLGRANCIGRTTNRVNYGAEKKAQGLAKAYLNWIRDNHPDTAKQE